MPSLRTTLKLPLIVGFIGGALVVAAFALAMDVVSPIAFLLGIALLVAALVLLVLRLVAAFRRGDEPLAAPTPSGSRPRPTLKPPLVVGGIGVALIGGAPIAAILGLPAFLSAGMGIIGIALLIGSLVLFVMRLTPAFGRHIASVEAAGAQRSEILAAHAAAGSRIGKSLLHGSVISGQHAGVRFEHRVIPGDKNTPPRSALSVPTSAPGEFHVHPESTGTEAAKMLGMVDEFRTGDAGFDLKHYFSGTTDEYVHAVFGVRENMAVLRALLARGFDQLEKTDGRLIVSRPGGAYLGIDEVRSAVSLLSKMSLPPVVAGTEGKKLLGKKPLYLVRGAAALVMATGLVAFYVSQPLLEGWFGFAGRVWPLVAVLCIAALAAAYYVLRGRSMSVRGMVELLMLAPILAIMLFGVLALANERLDTSGAEEHQVRLLRFWTTTGSKGARSFHMEFDSWRGRHSEEFSNVGEQVYSLARDGQIWKLRLRGGALGCLWVEAMAPIN